MHSEHDLDVFSWKGGVGIFAIAKSYVGASVEKVFRVDRFSRAVNFSVGSPLCAHCSNLRAAAAAATGFNGGYFAVC